MRIMDEEIKKGGNEEGIVTIAGLVMLLMLLILYAWMVPLINEAVGYAQSFLVDPLAKLLLSMMHFFILLGILITWFMYATTR